MFADVFNREGLARLVAGDGFVLGAVVLEHPPDFLHAGTQRHIPQKQRKLDRRFNQNLRPAAKRHRLAEQAGQKGG